MLSGVCAPFDWNDCDYNLQFIMDKGADRAVQQDRTIIFFNNYFKKDCFGLTYWQHEWLHIEIGHFHPNNDQCVINQGFYDKFNNSWMVSQE